MTFHSFLIKYGEIGIKGKNRYMFEDALVRQIRYALKDVDGEFTVHKCHGRVYVDCEGGYDYEETVESLKKVFGIVGICPVRGNLPCCEKTGQGDRRTEKRYCGICGTDVS